MRRKLGTMLALAGVLATAPAAAAFTMGEVTATTGVHGTLAASGQPGAAGTISGVNRTLGAAVATKEGQLASADGSVAWGGGGTTGWAAAGGGDGGWASGAGGWSAGDDGWAAGGQGNSAWVSGGWDAGTP